MKLLHTPHAERIHLLLAPVIIDAFGKERNSNIRTAKGSTLK
jgi:hypothetical protein